MFSKSIDHREAKSDHPKGSSPKFSLSLFFLLLFHFHILVNFSLLSSSMGFPAKKNGVNSSAIAENIFELTECPKGCVCDDGLKGMDCVGLDLVPRGIPPNWPSRLLERLSLVNCSLQTVERNAFRRFSRIRELRILGSTKLDLIDRHAFKLLKELRRLEIRGNRNLRELYKGSFSSIGNQHLLSIEIRDNAIERIRSQAFRNLQNIRELTIDERCVDIEPQAFSSMAKVDFITLRGVCSMAPFSLKNSSRVHSLTVLDSSFTLQTNVFSGLSHVNEIQLRQNKIASVERDSFAGLFTVGSVHLQSNYIGRLEPGAISGIENLGSLTLSYNTIRETLSSEECLRNQAQRFVFSENTLRCDCQMRWIQRMETVEDKSNNPLLVENYCDWEEQSKTLAAFKPSGCPPLLPFSSTNNNGSREPITFSSSTQHQPRHQPAVSTTGRREVPSTQMGSNWQNSGAPGPRGRTISISFTIPSLFAITTMHLFLNLNLLIPFFVLVVTFFFHPSFCRALSF